MDNQFEVIGEIESSLLRVIDLLEEQLEGLKLEFGEDRYLYMMDANGNCKATPILIALTNGYSALANLRNQND